MHTPLSDIEQLQSDSVPRQSYSFSNYPFEKDGVYHFMLSDLLSNNITNNYATNDNNSSSANHQTISDGNQNTETPMNPNVHSERNLNMETPIDLIVQTEGNHGKETPNPEMTLIEMLASHSAKLYYQDDRINLEEIANFKHVINLIE